jgi:Ca-activated chloride channel family protein
LPAPVARKAADGKPDVRLAPEAPAALNPGFGGTGGAGASLPKPIKLEEFARQIKAKGPGDNADKDAVGELRDRFEEQKNKEILKVAKSDPTSGAFATTAKAVTAVQDQKKALDEARRFFAEKNLEAVQNGQLGVDFAVQNNDLRNQSRLTRTASRNVQNRNVVEIGGVWIDNAFDPKMPVVTVKAMSKAYFKILERHPQIREVFQLGNHVVWVSPSGTALIIDQGDGREELPDADIDRLFVAKTNKK